MSDDEFGDWFARSLNNYSRDLARAYDKPDDGSQADAEAAARRMLPDGRATAGHHFLRILDGDVPAGWLWLGPVEDGVAWIYDIEVGDTERGRGVGTAALEAAETFVRTLGARAIALNVFGHNPRARALYEAVGYATVTTQMRKPLD
jgi:GNAT superfamily N-acetyltransferase